jgi:hypothetical protein
MLRYGELIAGQPGQYAEQIASAPRVVEPLR